MACQESAGLSAFSLPNYDVFEDADVFCQRLWECFSYYRLFSCIRVRWNSLVTAAVAKVMVRARRLRVTGVALMPHGV